MKAFVYLSEDSLAVMRSFTRTAERLISILEDVIAMSKESPEEQKETIQALARNAEFQKGLIVEVAKKMPIETKAAERKEASFCQF